MARTAHDRIETAQAAFEAGFASMAAKKRALDELNRAYDKVREAVGDKVRAYAFDAIPGAEEADYAARGDIFRANDLPFDLHQVRDRHFEIVGRWTDLSQSLRGMVDLRAAIKDAEIAPAPVKDEAAAKVEMVRKAIIDEMERRKAQYVEALEIGRLFNGLPVSVNAHWVHGHKGARFVRHFFYLRGKLTPLAVIMAAADTLKAEKEAGR